jgi:transposase
MILAVVPDITAFPSAAALASYAGLAPVSRRSGTSVRADLTPTRGHRQLKKSLFQSAFAALSDPVSGPTMT